ncbi:MAG: MucB/RseB C-terminal domain-containing protein [Betaproteobacteria bacterium]|nr:MucB/RseB C-terminal domain-containing protein [Betaproteobacteria bacterium]
MKRSLLRSACCLAFILSLPVQAQQQDGLYWLGRVVSAAHKLNYSGTFVYRNHGQEETSRITHLVDAGNEIERLEVLDGSPREVIRNNDEVRCYLPDSRVLIVEKRSHGRTFPALLSASLGGLAEHYSIRKGPISRVAERESQMVFLEPKDDLRYGQQLWVDVNTGLLLKVGMMNERNQAIETFAFTQLQIGGNIQREMLKSKFLAQSKNWRVHYVRATPSRAEDAAWLFKVQLPGFRKLAGMSYQSPSDSAANFHVVFSDGLAAISVFIETLPEKPELGALSMGAINVYRRAVGKNLLVVMGEVPQATLKKLGDGIEPKEK